MSALALALAGLALFGVVLLGFACSALLRLLREIQAAIAGGMVGEPRAMSEFIGTGMSLVMAIDRSCRTCIDRTGDLSELVNSLDPLPSNLSISVVTSGENSGIADLPESVALISDSALIGRMGVSIFPTGLVYDATGQEIGRSVLADRVALERLLKWTQERAATTPRSLTKESS